MSVLAKSHHLNWTAKLWLIVAAVFAVLWLVLWLTNDKQNTPVMAAKNTNNIVSYNLPTKIDNLNELSNSVAAINFETITKDLRNYPPEFKDKSYFQKNENKFTLEVMDVAEHQIITDYLENRPDRSKFAYFRYTDTNGNNRYVLTYGIMSSFQEALGVRKHVDFKLPNANGVQPEAMKLYLDRIDNYELGGQFAQEGDVAPIELKKTTREIPVAPAKQQEPVLSEDVVEEDVVRETAPKQEDLGPKADSQTKADGQNNANLKMAPTAKVAADEPAVNAPSDDKENKKQSTDKKTESKKESVESSPAAGSAEELQ